MTVQFTPKSRDLARSAYGVVVRSPGKRAVFIVLLVLLALLGGVSGGGTVWSFILAIAFVGVGLASVALASFVRPRSRRPRTIMFSEDGVEVRTPKTDVKRRWLSFKDLYIYSRGYVLTITASRTFIFIPRSAFASPDSEQDWLDLLRVHGIEPWTGR
jgi:hypothetical protein